jgi:Zn-finger nucleic acid-binding protein
MFRCPTCRSILTRLEGAHGYFWRCDACRGRAATMAVLRHALDRSQVNEMWHGAKDTPEANVVCPACSHFMATAAVDADGETVRVDVCRSCHLVWFDSWKFELFRPSFRQPQPTLAPHRLSRLLRWQGGKDF